MPARKRRPSTTTSTPTSAGPVDPVTQFGRLLRESNEREQAERERRAAAKRAASDAAAAAAAQAETLATARHDLDRAIAAVKEARATRRGVAEADAAWRQAKARVIELETGAAPEWERPAPPTGVGESADESADQTTDVAD
jgi:hypothetical protein